MWKWKKGDHNFAPKIKHFWQALYQTYGILCKILATVIESFVICNAERMHMHLDIDVHNLSSNLPQWKGILHIKHLHMPIDVLTACTACNGS